MRRLIIGISILALSACATTAALNAREKNEAFLDGVARSCGLPRSTLKLVGDTRVTLRPRLDADYKRVECAITEVGKGDALKLGFVGNEHFPEKAQK